MQQKHLDPISRSVMARAAVDAFFEQLAELLHGDDEDERGSCRFAFDAFVDAKAVTAYELGDIGTVDQVMREIALEFIDAEVARCAGEDAA